MGAAGRGWCWAGVRATAHLRWRRPSFGRAHAGPHAPHCRGGAAPGIRRVWNARPASTPSGPGVGSSPNRAGCVQRHPPALAGAGHGGGDDGACGCAPAGASLAAGLRGVPVVPGGAAAGGARIDHPDRPDWLSPPGRGPAHGAGHDPGARAPSAIRDLPGAGGPAARRDRSVRHRQAGSGGRHPGRHLAAADAGGRTAG